MNSTSRYRIVAAGIIGNVLEWYDFAIYGYFAAAIGRHFFPHQDPVAQLLSSFGVFAVGYLMRPVGGALIGHIGDRFGRRRALIFSVAAMAISTFLVALLPGYATIGLAAPVTLTLLRMVQGLSVGGEYTCSMVFLIEHAPQRRRGLMGSLAPCAASGGILLGSALGACFAAAMPTETLNAWGWRIPFLFGLVVGIAGYVLRRHMQETVVAERGKRAPIFETLHDHWRVVLRIAGLSAFLSVSFYLSFVYLVSWLQIADRIAPARALEITKDAGESGEDIAEAGKIAGRGFRERHAAGAAAGAFTERSRLQHKGGAPGRQPAQPGCGGKAGEAAAKNGEIHVIRESAWGGTEIHGPRRRAPGVSFAVHGLSLMQGKPSRWRGFP